jgi:hypothetical protein
MAARLAYAAITAVALAACGGGSGGGRAALPPSSTAAPQTLAKLTFKIGIPVPSTSAHARKPDYVSQATASIAITLMNPPLGFTPIPVTNVTPGSGACPQVGQVYQCTIPVLVPPGSDSFTIAAWSAANGTGSVLSQQVQTFNVVAGVNNILSFTLDANAATMTVSGTANCASSPLGTVYGTLGTTAATLNVTYTDAAGKTIVAPGLPTLAAQASGVSGGTIGIVINQANQTVTLTPSGNGVSGTVTITATPANSNGSGDGLSFTQTKAITFANGLVTAHGYLAAVEQTGASGQIDLYTVSLGGSGGPDSFSAASPASLAITNSVNESKPDIDNPAGLAFDSSGNLLVANGGTGVSGDFGDLACIPAFALAAPGVNMATTTSTNVKTAAGLAYGTDSSVAVANSSTSATYQLPEFILSGNYTAASSPRNLAAAGFGALSVTALPSLAAGSYAVALTSGGLNPPHGSGTSKVAVFTAAGGETDIADSTIDVPTSVAWDPINDQLAIASNSAFNPDLDLYTLSPATQVKVINTGYKNYLVAAAPNGYLAVAGTTSTGYPKVQVYDATSSRNAVGGPIPFNTTTTACGSTYIYGSAVVKSMQWLSSTKLLIALSTTTSAKNGLYIFDVSATATPGGFDDVTCAAPAAAPEQTAFQALTNTPLGTAYKP